MLFPVVLFHIGLLNEWSAEVRWGTVVPLYGGVYGVYGPGSGSEKECSLQPIMRSLSFISLFFPDLFLNPEQILYLDGTWMSPK